MKYTETNKIEFAGIDDFFKCYPGVKKAEDHPQYKTFKETLLSWGLSEKDILDDWKLLIDGVVLQETLNQTADALILSMNIDSQWEHYSCGDSVYEDICKNIFKSITKEKDKLTFYKNVVKASNINYAEFADKLKGYLLTDSKTLSLWSGGHDLSPLSQLLGNCPLEQTKLGRLLDTLPLTTQWKLEAPLWNIVSRTFVKEYCGHQVHVYLRTVDKESVLLRQEIPMLEKLGKTIHWHIFYYNGTQLAEIGGKQDDSRQWVPMAVNVGDFKNGWCSSHKAFEMLADQLRGAQYTTNSRAIQQVLYKEFPEYHAPFAFYE